MYFFTNYTFTNVATAVVTLILLLLVNELTRRNKYVAIGTFMALPLILTLFVWGTDEGSSSGTWFAWVKTFSALAGVIGFMAIRYIKKLEINKIALLFPFFILALNIVEAVIRDFQVYSQSLSAVDGIIYDGGLTIIGGSWNLMNGAAGILNILTITGWLGIRVSNSKSKDMIWPDQLLIWIIAYDVWNMAYTYNCLTNRAFYAGFLILIAATIAAKWIKKGAWLQHRSHTLALWGMFSLTFAYSNTPYFNIETTANTNAMFMLSLLALVVNIGLAVFVVYKSVKLGKNPYTNEVFSETKEYKTIISENHLE